MDEKYLINKSTLVGIADAIRTQKGTTDLIDPVDFANEIASLKENKEGCRIRYIDVDGTILKEEYVQKGGTTKPPSNPSYDSDRLMFVSWNCRSDEIEWEDMETWHLVVDGDRDIGATYRTRDGCTYLFCKLTTITGLNPTLAVTGDVTIDWGDGTIDNLLTHTYAEAGEYIIKIDGANGFDASGSELMGSWSLNDAIKKCYISQNINTISDNIFASCRGLSVIVIGHGVCNIGEYTFEYCCSLSTVIIPSSVQTIGDCAFGNCFSLTNILLSGSVTDLPLGLCTMCRSLPSITIPNGVKFIDSYAFSGCVALRKVTMPQDITDINDAFINCWSLQRINIPNNLTTIKEYAFSDCCLKNVIIPSKVTSIERCAFDLGFSIANYVIQCTSVPNLSSTDAFNGIQSLCVMWVNDDIIEELKVATNWSAYADHMQPLSTMPQDLREELGV